MTAHIFFYLGLSETAFVKKIVKGLFGCLTGLHITFRGFAFGRELNHQTWYEAIKFKYSKMRQTEYETPPDAKPLLGTGIYDLGRLEFKI